MNIIDFYQANIKEHVVHNMFENACFEVFAVFRGIWGSHIFSGSFVFQVHLENGLLCAFLDAQVVKVCGQIQIICCC